MSRWLVLVGFCAVLVVRSVCAEPPPNLFVLEGLFRQETSYAYTVTANPGAPGPVTITIPLPSSGRTLGHSQEIASCELLGVPSPDRQWEETDVLGNTWASMHWSWAAGELQLTRQIYSVEETFYRPIVTSSKYPVDLRTLPLEAIRWLGPTPEIQSTAREVRELSSELVDGSVAQIEAVGRILAWVRSNVRYACSAELCDPVPRVDASFTLDRLMGNCVNFANLTMALLRAAGIPALPVNGFVADRPESRASHAWIAVYFPDLGWVELESANWMPANREVPVTFLLPQHITLFRGDGRGVSHAPFSERHFSEFEITSRPAEVTQVSADIGPGCAVSWVVTLRSTFNESALFTLSVEGLPPDWHADISERMVVIDPDGIGRTHDVLLTVVPPANAQPGDRASVTVRAQSGGAAVGSVSATVTVASP